MAVYWFKTSYNSYHFDIEHIPGFIENLLFSGCTGDVECDGDSQNKINIYRQFGGPVINAVPCATSKQGLHPDWRTATAAPPASTG